MTVNGVEINYEDTLTGDDAILFLSGTAGTIGLWRRFQIPHFRRRFRVLAMDYRCTGGSELHPDRFSTEQLAADALALLRAVGVDRAHIVAHSMGASVAIAAASLSPERVRSLVLCSSGGHLDPERVTTRGIPIKLVLQLVEKGYTQRMRDHYTGHFWWPASYTEQNPQRVSELAETLIRELPPLEYYLKHVQARQEFDILRHLKNLQAPTFLLVGAEENILDGTMPHLEAAQRLHALIAGSELWAVPGSAHGYLWQDEAAVNTAIERFLLAH